VRGFIRAQATLIFDQTLHTDHPYPKQPEQYLGNNYATEHAHVEIVRVPVTSEKLSISLRFNLVLFLRGHGRQSTYPVPEKMSLRIFPIMMA
jgi:hypothetical protein